MKKTLVLVLMAVAVSGCGHTLPTAAKTRNVVLAPVRWMLSPLPVSGERTFEKCEDPDIDGLTLIALRERPCSTEGFLFNPSNSRQAKKMSKKKIHGKLKIRLDPATPTQLKEWFGLVQAAAPGPPPRLVLTGTSVR